MQRCLLFVPGWPSVCEASLARGLFDLCLRETGAGLAGSAAGCEPWHGCVLQGEVRWSTKMDHRGFPHNGYLPELSPCSKSSSEANNSSPLARKPVSATLPVRWDTQSRNILMDSSPICCPDAFGFQLFGSLKRRGRQASQDGDDQTSFQLVAGLFATCVVVLRIMLKYVACFYPWGPRTLCQFGLRAGIHAWLYTPRLTLRVCMRLMLHQVSSTIILR